MNAIAEAFNNAAKQVKDENDTGDRWFVSGVAQLPGESKLSMVSGVVDTHPVDLVQRMTIPAIVTYVMRLPESDATWLRIDGELVG